MIGILLILTLIVVYIYHMTKNWMLAAGIEAVGIAAALIVYFVKSSLYENLLTKLLGRLALADVFKMCIRDRSWVRPLAPARWCWWAPA